MQDHLVLIGLVKASDTRDIETICRLAASFRRALAVLKAQSSTVSHHTEMPRGHNLSTWYQ